MQGTEVFKDAKLEDIIADPKKFGAPTFSEYKANPFKYRIDWASIASNGSKQLSRNQVAQSYKLFGYEVKKIEYADKIAKDHGHDLRDMTIHPQIVNQGGQKFNIVVEFRPKEGTLIRG